MLEDLKLQRPLACIDFETTGPNPRHDRIVQAGLTLFKDGAPQVMVGLVNPGCPIPAEATKVHGITDEMVAKSPRWANVADGFLGKIAGCDIIGFGIKRFDLPLLHAELERCGKKLDLSGRNVIDVMAIFHRKEPRDLTAAVSFYLGEAERKDAHTAGQDSFDTLRVLDAMMGYYNRQHRGLPRTPEALAAMCVDEGALDSEGKFVLRGQDVVINFGKHKGRSIRELYGSDDRNYLTWAHDTLSAECRTIIKAEVDKIRRSAGR